jgi:hypothetical protein
MGLGGSVASLMMRRWRIFDLRSVYPTSERWMAKSLLNFAINQEIIIISRIFGTAPESLFLDFRV